MADISKCKGKRCKLKYECYRFLAPDDDIYQAYMSESPYKEYSKTCEYFLDNICYKKNTEQTI